MHLKNSGIGLADFLKSLVIQPLKLLCRLLFSRFIPGKLCPGVGNLRTLYLLLTLLIYTDFTNRYSAEYAFTIIWFSKEMRYFASSVFVPTNTQNRLPA